MDLVITAVVGILAGGVVTRLYYQPVLAKVKAAEAAARQAVAAEMKTAQEKVQGK